MNLLRDYPIPCLIGGLTGLMVLFGLIMVFSATGVDPERALKGDLSWQSMTAMVSRQAMGVLVGTVALLVCMHIKVGTWQKLSWYLLGVAFVLLALCYVEKIGAPVSMPNGGQAYRWIKIGFLKFQPSELAKLFLVIYLASVWGRKRDVLHESPWYTYGPLALVALMVLMIILEPNKSTAIFLGVLALGMWFLAHGQLWKVSIGSLVFTVTAVVFIVLSPYALARVKVWFLGDPLEPWQPRQAIIAHSRGGLLGMGLGGGEQKLGYLPECYNDMIFAVIAEETGLFGVTLLILAYVLLGILGLHVASRCGNPVGALLAVGVTIMVVAQALMNIAVATGVFPVTGLCLPFISYGSTSLVVSMAAIGILINVARSVCQADEIGRRTAVPW